jgi:hypothetical protein
MSSAPMQLFVGGRLKELLAAASQRAADALSSWQPDDLLNTPEADIAEQLIELATAVEVPVLDRDKAQFEPPTEVSMDVVDFGRHFQATVTRFTLVVPITGDPSLLGVTASRISPSPLLGEIDRSAGTVRLHCNNPDDAAQARAYFEQKLDEIEQRLEWTRADIEQHNHLVAKQLAQLVTQRRTKLLKDRDLQASIGYPIMKRQDADSYSVPLRRKKITPTRPARSPSANAFVPEPAIDDADYEAVLTVLRNARNALERNPGMSSKLDEEEVRNLLLVPLNAQFEGKAAGEVFLACVGQVSRRECPERCWPGETRWASSCRTVRYRAVRRG